jgi:hypothetical protein
MTGLPGFLCELESRAMFPALQFIFSSHTYIKSMKTVLILMLAAAAAFSAAQVPSYPYPRNSGAGPASQGQASNGQRGSNSKANAKAGNVVPTEVIRVLSTTSAQKELSLTSDELASLGEISRNILAVNTSEGDAFAAVSKALTTTQIAKLQQLMVEDLGYGALALSAVRSKLTLTEAQSSQVSTLVDIQEAAKRAILSQSSNADSAVKAVSQLASLTNSALAKILTSTQDSALHKLAVQ